MDRGAGIMADKTGAELDSRISPHREGVESQEGLDSEKQTYLLFSRVKNNVLVTNPNIRIPLQLEEGKPTNIGLFLESASEEQQITEGQALPLEVWPHHQRSALLARVNFSDNQGRIYHAIDLKGIGYFIVNSKTGVVEIRKPGSTLHVEGVGGLVGKTEAYDEYETGEELTKAGARVSRVLAIIGIDELIVNGRKLSLEEAVENGVIDKDFKPVVEVRGFGTKARIMDLYRGRDNKKLFNDVKKLVAEELGIRKTITNEEYFKWFAKNLGKNLAVLHKLGLYHEGLTVHNVTLLSELTDLEEVNYLSGESKRLIQRDEGENLISGLTNFVHLMGETSEDNQEDAFLEEYREAYSQNYLRGKVD